MTASPETIAEVFAWAPLTAFVVVMFILYRATRGGHLSAASPSKTFACAQCGRRGSREHMVPVTHEGAVVWYCSRCAH